MNACIRLDSVVGVLNVESYNYATLPSQVPIRKMEYGSTAKNIFVVARYWYLKFQGHENLTAVIGVPREI